MNTDLTTGKPAGMLLRFTLPMLLSVAFQQLYNISDSVIAGKFAGEDALAAVGASYPVTMIFMAVAFGMNIGISVIISQLFGAKDYKQMKTAAYTGFIAVAVISVVLTAFGIVFCEPILRLLGTPENIMADTALYLAIYIWGLLFLYFYNISSGVFTSLGDSKTPLYFLIASSLGNIVLDAVFVIVFHWGVAGVAWATFLAQGVASICAFLAVLRRLRSIETREKPALFSGRMLKRIAVVAVPSILQQSFVSVGNLCIQGLINGFGSSAVAGYSAAVKLNTFAITSLTALGNSTSSFAAQNIGARKTDRVRSGFRAGCLMSLAVASVFLILYVFFGGTMLRLFLDESSAEALGVGVQFLWMIPPFYLAVAVKLTADAVLRGSGVMVYFMITTFLDLVLRVVLAFILVGPLGLTGIWLSWPIGWVISSVLSVIFYLCGVWDTNRRKVSA
ncbi:MAG: MATE family efflux transporter, partial [Hominenteromicrobium sp.]